MKFRDVLLYILKSPSRWFSGLKILLYILLRQQEITIKTDGVNLTCGLKRGEGVWCALRGLDYEAELRLFLSQLQPDDIVIDLGANIGAYTIRSAIAVAPSGKVYAFEPLERTRKRLKKSIHRNNIGNISVIPEAVGSQSGSAKLIVRGRGSSASIAEKNQDGEIHQVAATTIDDFIMAHKITRVNWIKMDIEGAEPLALEGMRNTITTFRPNFLFENESGGVQSASILRTLGYKIGTITLNGSFIETSCASNLFAYPHERIPVNPT